MLEAIYISDLQRCRDVKLLPNIDSSITPYYYLNREILVWVYEIFEYTLIIL